MDSGHHGTAGQTAVRIVEQVFITETEHVLIQLRLMVVIFVKALDQKQLHASTDHVQVHISSETKNPNPEISITLVFVLEITV